MELVVCCAEAEASSGSTFQKRACQKIDALLCEHIREANKLYDPYRNLYLDKCYGESKTPLGAWIDLGPRENDL